MPHRFSEWREKRDQQVSQLRLVVEDDAVNPSVTRPPGG
jgi:hypothetical protein